MRDRLDRVVFSDKEVTIYVSTSPSTCRFISLPLSDVDKLIKGLSSNGKTLASNTSN